MMSTPSLLLHHFPRKCLELTRGQRAGWVLFVIGVHAIFGWWVLRSAQPVVTPQSRGAIVVTLVQDGASLMASPDASPPVMPLSQHAPSPVMHDVTQPVLSSTNTAAPSVMQAPISPSVAQNVPPNEMPLDAAAQLPAQAAAAPMASAAEAVMAPLQAEPKVLPSSSVRYAQAPVLSYPRVSRELSQQGEVMLKVLVDEQGRPRDIELLRSSGYSRLDHQAVLAMTRARFQPHLENGIARKVWVIAPMKFNFED